MFDVHFPLSPSLLDSAPLALNIIGAMGLECFPQSIKIITDKIFE